MKVKQEKTENKELRDRVELQLEWEPEVTSTDIGVAADDGIVTLTGSVESYSEKLAAENAAKHTWGVKGIANDITVTPIMKVTDSDIAARAVSALEARSNIPSKDIKVIVKDEFIYLEGKVEWKFQKDAAENAVNYLLGAQGVINNIKIRPTVSSTKISSTEIKNKIEEAFRRSAEVDADRLVVTTHDGIVELRGNVRTWAEIREAERVSWAAPGVTKVDSHLHIIR